MKIPQGMSHQQTMAVINNVCNKCKYKYRFGYHDEDDLYQESFIFAMEGLENYDGSSPLENFLTVHVNNRLKNFKRDNYYRVEYVCNTCTDGTCQSCQRRELRNETKRLLMEPIDIDEVRDDGTESNTSYTPDILGDLITQELLDLIDSQLDINLRTDYLRIKHGVYVSQPRRQRVEEAVLRIIGSDI